MTSDTSLRQTALYDCHVAGAARMVPYAGFSMPVQYAGILQEHDAVRHRAGLFDLSHMGQFELTGDAVAEWADGLCTNAVATMKPWQARYNIFCNERGGAHDDTIFYRLDGRWLLVVNGANVDKMWDLLNDALPANGIELQSFHGKRALIAIQGPKSVEMLASHVPVDIGALKYYFCTETTVDGVPALLARTGYTGEDGFELFVDGDAASGLWKNLLDRHAGEGLEACGLGSRDVLRLEAGMPLYGHELTEEITPIQAGQSWAVKLNKTFTGRDALEAQVAAGDYSRIAGLIMTGPVPAREGYAVQHGGQNVGEIRSGSRAPSVENKNVATALLDPGATALGTELEVEIRGKSHPATVVPLPFYKRSQPSK
jgi:aminomethyltransferase